MRSNAFSSNGSARASPRTGCPTADGGTSPASVIAVIVPCTCFNSVSSASKATTCAPRRSAAKACRPPPQPMSRRASPGPTCRRSRSTVSIDRPLREHGPPHLDEPLGVGPPGEAGEHARTAAAPMRARWPGSLSRSRIAAVSADGSAGATVRALSPSGPTTSGSAPPVVATTGTPHAMASTAGSENPSYSEGTTATSASAYSSTMRSSVTPDTNCTAPSRPSARSARGHCCPP